MGTHFVLVAGLWLGGWAWDDVGRLMRERGQSVSALTLPGLESAGVDRSAISLADHVAALDRAVSEAGSEVVVVAHSGAGKVVSSFLDRSPGAVTRVVYVDSGPSGPGATEDLPADVVELPLPSWEDLAAAGNSLEGLSAADLERFRSRAVPHPAGVLRDRLELVNHSQRRAVPSTIVACSMTSALVTELAAAGHPMLAEVAELSDLSFLEVPTGHWPMWSKPQELAEAVLEAVG